MDNHNHNNHNNHNHNNNNNHNNKNNNRNNNTFTQQNFRKLTISSRSTPSLAYSSSTPSLYFHQAFIPHITLLSPSYPSQSPSQSPPKLLSKAPSSRVFSTYPYTVLSRTRFHHKPSTLSFFHTNRTWATSSLQTHRSSQSPPVHLLSANAQTPHQHDPKSVPGPDPEKSLVNSNQTSYADLDPSSSSSSDASSSTSAIASPSILASIQQFFSRIFQAMKRNSLTFIFGLVIGFSASFVSVDFTQESLAIRQSVILFDEILNSISASYLEPVDISKLFEIGVNAMLTTLDPYTQFESYREAQQMTVKTIGNYAGIGAAFSADYKNPNQFVVVSAFEGYAFDKGLRPGDVLLQVDQAPVNGWTINQVVDALKGQPGTSVKVRVARQGIPDPVDLVLDRTQVQLKDVSTSGFVGDPADGVGYIAVSSFSKQVGDEVLQAVLALKNSSQTPLKAILLDLRNNPGGVLEAAVDVAELFVPKDSLIVSYGGRTFDKDVLYISSKDPVIDPTTKLAVLVNNQTASAAELVAGAIQDLDAGIIVGSKTYGKGLMQNFQTLPFNTAVRYTVGKYYTPSGRCIQSVNYKSPTQGLSFESIQVEEADRKEFKTKNGRIVRDGGGIEPDIDFASPKKTYDLEAALSSQGYFFYFANSYVGENPNIDVDSFHVTPKIYNAFVHYVEDSGFEFKSPFNTAVSDLQSFLSLSGYTEASKEMDHVQQKIATEMKASLLKPKPEIYMQLERAIRMRLEPDSKRILQEARNDPEVAKAIQVLNDSQKYYTYLQAKLPS